MSQAPISGRPAWLARSCVGQVKLLGGKLEGWCFYPDRPRQRAIVDLHVDGVRRHVASAARPRPDLRLLGLGDGHFGFSVALDAPELAAGAGCVVEVTERRFDQVLGRVAVGAGGLLAQLGRRLDRSEGVLRDAALRLDAAGSRPLHDMGDVLGELGEELLARRRCGPHAILSGRGRLDDVPAMTIPWREQPGFSLVVLGGGGAGGVARAIRHAAAALAKLSVEVILLDDGASPLACLLPTRIRNLRLVRADRGPDVGGFINAGVLAARGEAVGVVAWDRLQPAGLAEAFSTLRNDTIHLEHSAPLLAEDGGTASRPVPLHGGLRCLLPREAFLALGGLEHGAAEPLAWDGLGEKARAAGMALEHWHVPRPFGPAVAGAWH